LFFSFGTMSAMKIFMNSSHYRALFLAGCIPAAVFLVAGDVGAASDKSQKEARVTRIIRDVKLLPSKSTARAAVVNEKVREGTAVRTGDESRSELTFVDLTITRLGANSIFNFNKAGRSVELGAGSVLLRVPKDSGGARISTSAVTVGVTGTTVILESTRVGRNKLIVLEGGARLSLNKHAGESVNLRGGQMEDVPAGATKLPPPVNIDVDDVMQKHPLITDFAPLPSRDLIYATRTNQPVYQGQPAGGGTGVSVAVPVLGTLIGATPLRPYIPRHRTGKSTGTTGTNDGVASEGETGYGSKGSKKKNPDGTGTEVLTRGAKERAKPSPTPPRRRKKSGPG
jgi:hypothetical protein